mmetsp:Transcript_134730/g.190509  ORF Transcript_134730/g.190509 Transcript_134730/m.190509 type:complete len:109 (-) Transcript_134730:371-697(-)
MAPVTGKMQGGPSIRSFGIGRSWFLGDQQPQNFVSAAESRGVNWEQPPIVSELCVGPIFQKRQEAVHGTDMCCTVQRRLPQRIALVCISSGCEKIHHDVRVVAITGSV